jgi:hypothetical protein
MSAKDKVCAEIQEIMRTYREQEASGGVDTPGGLEHMGDVWRLLRRWDTELGLTQKDYFESKLPPTP